MCFFMYNKMSNFTQGCEWEEAKLFLSRLYCLSSGLGVGGVDNFFFSSVKFDFF